MAVGRSGQRLTRHEQAELDAFKQTLRRGAVAPTRRDLLRWSALAAGAVATARFGIGPGAPALAAPRAQDATPPAGGAEITVPFDAYGQSVTLDPHQSADYGGFWVVYPNVWAGLLRFDENGRVVRDLADNATVTPDGLTYTFTLRQGLTYASGNPVQASHFLQSWARALDPANPSPMAQFFRYVKGYDDYMNQVQGAALGFSSPDEQTLVVELADSHVFFPSYMASFVWAVVDPDILAQAGDQDFVLNLAGAGPWQFSAFELDTQFVMDPNPKYYGGNSATIGRINWPIFTGPTAAQQALDLYKQDKAVSADVPLSLKKAVESDATLAKEVITLDKAPGSVRSLAMDFRQPPFDDVRVRLAFALAFDRKRYAEIYENTWVPATVFTPPVVTTLSGYQPPDGMAFDVAKAKQLLADAGFPNGQNLPDITFYHPSGDTDEEIGRVRDVLTMLADNLGIKLTFDRTKSEDDIENIRKDKGGLQIAIMWWQNVTETPHLLTDVFSADSPYMQGFFNWATDLAAKGGFDPGADAKAFTDLVGQAETEMDQGKRNDLYKQAEAFVLKNAVYAPIANWTPMFVQKPYLQGTKQGTWTGRFPVLFDKDVNVVQQ
ncbi:MAG TPA: peptide ABC transporter substrate-binding protein [Thermomicrobiales bacterium]|nr:peptide ABC transporter substrate-binding protein [Thermomicrobiales bacterium]